MSTFHWTEDYACEEISGAKGWVFYNFALENRATMFGALVERVGDGYIAKERKRLANDGRRT